MSYTVFAEAKNGIVKRFNLKGISKSLEYKIQ